MKIELAEDEYEALREIVYAWVDEGFTVPPYKDAVYRVFEHLGISNADRAQRGYDLDRPLKSA